MSHIQLSDHFTYRKLIRFTLPSMLMMAFFPCIPIRHSSLAQFYVLLAFYFSVPPCMALGAEGEDLEQCMIYGRVVLIFLPPYILQTVFQSFLVTAEKLGLGMIVTAVGGVCNIIFDILLIVVLDMGILGAALATYCNYGYTIAKMSDQHLGLMRKYFKQNGGN